MATPGSQRLWVGPLMLILVIALIYVFSLMPSAPPHRDYVPDMSGEIRIDRNDDMAFAPPLVPHCTNGGTFNDTTGACDCLNGFSGVRCHIPSKTICLNEGIYSPRLGHCLCHGTFVGEHCELRCSGGIANHTSNSCDCLGRFFGKQCDVLCMHGEIQNGTCKCNAGYVGASCAACDPTSAGESCEHYMKRRGAVNSRLTLSGLSFCMITIGLLCVTARRRRAGMNPGGDETWYRVFNPATNRPGHDFMCGGSWFPRDRALLVAPGRATVSHGNRRNQQSRSGSRRLATPPPSYTSVDNLTEEPMPPTYEEATRVLESEDRHELIVDETAASADKEEAAPPAQTDPVPSPSTSSDPPPPTESSPQEA